jgi:hypothetical protein
MVTEDQTPRHRGRADQRPFQAPLENCDEAAEVDRLGGRVALRLGVHARGCRAAANELVAD